MMVSWPAIIMSIVRLGLVSLVVSVRNLGWHPAPACSRVGSFSLPAGVATRPVSLNRAGQPGLLVGTFKWKIVVQTSDHKSKLWMYKIYKQAMHVYIIFMHANLGKFAISRNLHAPTQNDESFPTIWCWNIWTKIGNIYSPPPPPSLHRCREWRPTVQWFDIEMWTPREHLEMEILQSSLELGNQDY